MMLKKRPMNLKMKNPIERELSELMHTKTKYKMMLMNSTID